MTAKLLEVGVLALAFSSAMCSSSRPSERIAASRSALVSGPETLFWPGAPRIARDGSLVVESMVFPQSGLARVMCLENDGFHALQTLDPLPGSAQSSQQNVALSQGTVAVSTWPNAPSLPELLVYTPSGGGWKIEATLSPPASVTAADQFAWALTSTGSSIFASVSPFGAQPSVEVYSRSASGWAMTQALLPDNGETLFGSPMAASGDVLAVVGATPQDDAGTVLTGDIHVFEHGPSGWSQTQELLASDAQAGGFAAVATDSNTIVAGAPDADGGLGAAYVFERDTGGTWHQTATLTASDVAVGYRFGLAVGVGGDLIAVGAPGLEPLGGALNGLCKGFVPCVPGADYVFQRAVSGWEQALKLGPSNSTPGDQFGVTASMSSGVLVTTSSEDLFAYSLGDTCTTSSDCDGGACTGGVCTQPTPPCLPMADGGAGDAGPDAPLDAPDAGSAEAGRDATPDVADARSETAGADAAPEGGVGPARGVSASGGCGCRLAREREDSPWHATWLVGAVLAMLGARRRRKPGPPAPI